MQCYRLFSASLKIGPMKQPQTKPPPTPLPRQDSLLHRLQNAPPPDDAPPHLDQLMIFLETPPPDVRDRWKKGAEMCAEWGIPCTGASVWRLYRSHVLEWRLRLAREATPTTEPPESLEEKATQLVALRTFEVLANPNSTAADLLSLARIQFRKQTLEFARQKHSDNQRDKLNLALDALKVAVHKNREARFAFNKMRSSLFPKEFPPDACGNFFFPNLKFPNL